VGYKTFGLPTTRTQYALLFLALFVPFTYFNHSDGWNQGVRLAELHAVTLKGTLRIDDYIDYTGDRAFINGHYYSEKAPAMALAALPAFAITAWTQKLLGVDPDAMPGRRVSEWIATAGSVGLIAATGGLAFFAMLRARFDALTALLATFGLFLGSLTWPYATALFSHAGTIGLLAIALWAALTEPSKQRDAIAGLAAGFAVASEYPAVFPGAVLALYLASLDLGRFWRFGLATLPAAALILLNNYAISGSPFKLSYGSNPLFPELTAVNTYGFNTPNLSAMRAVLWGEYRGLLFWCPVLLMAIPGIVAAFRANLRLALLMVAAITVVLLQVAAFYTWFGGNAIGPRYLAPALPFFGLAAAYGIKRFPEMGLILTIASVALMGMVTAIAIDPPGDVLEPLQLFYLVRIEQNRFAENLGTLIGLPLSISLIVPLVFPAIAAWSVLKEPRVSA
jgi:MFS family permease